MRIASTSIPIQAVQPPSRSRDAVSSYRRTEEDRLPSRQDDAGERVLQGELLANRRQTYRPALQMPAVATGGDPANRPPPAAGSYSTRNALGTYQKLEQIGDNGPGYSGTYIDLYI